LLGATLMMAAWPGLAVAGAGAGSCSDLVYLVDDASQLVSFDPREIGVQDPFAVIGTLVCPTLTDPVPGYPGPVSPYSLTVDRTGNAHVLFTTGELFTVALSDASCTATSFEPQQGGQWLLFQQAFASDAPGSGRETQFVGGGDASGAPGGLFGLVDPSTFVIQSLGSLPNVAEASPSLTGLGDGTLYGFYPGQVSAFVQEIDKTSGAAVGPTLPVPGGLGSTAIAWAFAHWGGQFYLFLTRDDGLGNLSASVARIDRSTGSYDVVLSNVPYVFTAAGVSTCAPLTVPEPDEPAVAGLAALLFISNTRRHARRGR
jgi:hypothetical protein